MNWSVNDDALMPDSLCLAWCNSNYMKECADHVIKLGAFNTNIERAIVEELRAAMPTGEGDWNVPNGELFKDVQEVFK